MSQQVEMTAPEDEALEETLDLWGPGEAVDEARDILQLLDMWEEDNDGDTDQCTVGPEGVNAGCCLTGQEPLTDLCDRLDKAYVAPKLAVLFAQVLADAEAPCVTVEAMRAAIRSKVERRVSL